FIWVAGQSLAPKSLRAARANHVFWADEKRIRPENTVIVNNKDSAEGLYTIVDYARICFSSVRNRRSARTVSRPRNFATLQQW
ncbi:MAG: hypothetical protein AAB133_09405, partial [Pseudomonadota bacterium]